MGPGSAGRTRAGWLRAGRRRVPSCPLGLPEPPSLLLRRPATHQQLPAPLPGLQVAQALSTRVDLLPPAYLLAIQRLQVGRAAPSWGAAGLPAGRPRFPVLSLKALRLREG